MEFNNFTKIMLYTLLFLFIVFGVVLIWFYYNNKNEINQLDADVVEIKINGKEFKLKIADTYKKKTRGSYERS